MLQPRLGGPPFTEHVALVEPGVVSSVQYLTKRKLLDGNSWRSSRIDARSAGLQLFCKLDPGYQRLPYMLQL